MSDNFYYFFPRIVNADEYAGLGLGHAFRRPPAVTQLSAEQGPAGAAGTVLHSGAAPALPRLKWYKATDQMWIGHNPHDPPTPERLRNQTEITAGSAVRLADGNYWAIPRVLACNDRDPGRASGLPPVITGVDESGEVEIKPDSRWDDLRERAARLLEAYNGAGTGALAERERIEFAGAVLGVCYAVTLDELCTLEVLTPGAARVIGLDAIDALEREKALMSRTEAGQLDRLELVSYAQAEAIIQSQEG